MTGDIERGIVRPAAQEAREPRTHWLFYLGATLFVGGMVWLAVISFTQSGQIAALQDDSRDSRQQAAQLYDQVVKLGGTPVVQPAPVVVPGAPGVAGAQGIPGHEGPPGKSPACLDTPRQCQGVDGEPGQPGPEGKAGQAGAMGPGGPAGPAGPAGPGGPAGPAGVSVTRQYFDRDESGACRNFNDFSDGRVHVDQGAAGDAACPAAPPSSPPEQTPAVLPTATTLRRRD